MSKNKSDFSRRDFLKTAGAVGLGSMLSPVESLAFTEVKSDTDNSQPKAVPIRPFGKTGAKVSILGLGGAFHWSNFLLLKQALKMGVTYWDTASSYGESETAIGKFFEKFPEDREKVFLVTKCESSDPQSMTRSLETSLKKMKTSYVDLFFIHQVSSGYNINRATKIWAEKAKASGKIHYFGFSTHKNMEYCLKLAADVGWIDGIMLSYNFRIMHSEMMKNAIEDCFNAGIGLTAMKTMAKGGWGTDSITPNEKEQKLFNLFKKKGFTVEQAKLKAVWGDHRIASICSHMTNMKNLSANISAAIDSNILSDQDFDHLKKYAHETSSNYCTGCAYICESTLDYQVPVADVMRYLMYAHCYGEPDKAKLAFKKLPAKVRKLMAYMDYNEAEQRCPQKMQISRLMRKAIVELA